MKKVGYISDLHMDFYIRETDVKRGKFKRSLTEFVARLLPNEQQDVDTLLIAGDTGHYNSQTKALLIELQQHFKDIFIVTGNHDLYLLSDTQGVKYGWDSWNRERDIKEFCKLNGIHFLSGQTVDIDGIKIAGLGMTWDGSWLNFMPQEHRPKHLKTPNEIRSYFENYMNDSRYISADGEQSRFVTTAYGGRYLHTKFDPLKYAKAQMEKLKAIQEADVVVTHYIPVPYESMPPIYKENTSTMFYTFDGEAELLRLNPKVWVFGHTHEDVDEMYRGTRLLCNALGYPGEYTNAKIKVFEI